MDRCPTAVAAVAALALLLAACTDGWNASGAGDVRLVAVRMFDEMRFDPAAFDFFAGDTVRFEVTNEGALRHEFFVGDVAAQEEHAAEMRETDGSAMAHDEPNGLSVEPGGTETLEITFEEAGGLQVGCHEPGHLQAGMAAPITIHP